MPSTNSGRAPKRVSRRPVPSMPRARGGDVPLNKQSLASGKAKVVKKNGKRLTLQSKDQKTEWLFVPKRAPRVIKSQRKA